MVWRTQSWSKNQHTGRRMSAEHLPESLDGGVTSLRWASGSSALLPGPPWETPSLPPSLSLSFLTYRDANI